MRLLWEGHTGLRREGENLVRKHEKENLPQRHGGRKLLPGRALAGPPMDFEGLAHEPANELGVVFFFGTQAHRLGFRVLTFQQEFPDCEAMREVRPGKWQWVRRDCVLAA
jgi:hypothetical protein